MPVSDPRSQHPPSYAAGVARGAYESEYPLLWRGLIGAWVPRLGHRSPDATDGRLHDLSGFKLDATVGVSITWVHGGSGWNSKHVADNTQNKFIAGDNARFATMQMSVAHRFRLTTMDATYFPVEKNTGNRQIEHNVTSAGRMRMAHYNGSAQALTDWANGTIVVNTWYSVVSTYDGTTIKAHKDGVPFGTNAALAGPITDSGGDLTFGAMKGEMSYAMIWNRVLSPREIADLHADPMAMYRLAPRQLQRRILRVNTRDRTGAPIKKFVPGKSGVVQVGRGFANPYAGKIR